MSMLPKKTHQKHAKGQDDHVDAWLMSYADLITLLFTFFVIFVSITIFEQKKDAKSLAHNDAPPVVERSGLLALGTPYDKLFNDLRGVVASNFSDQDIAIEKTPDGLLIDLAATRFFDADTADIAQLEMPLLKQLAHAIKAEEGAYMIEIQGHTDDAPIATGLFKNNWELAALRATNVVGVMIDEGIAPERLKATSFAGTRPLVPNEDAAGKPIAKNQERNERILIKLTVLPKAPQVFTGI